MLDIFYKPFIPIEVIPSECNKISKFSNYDANFFFDKNGVHKVVS